MIVHNGITMNFSLATLSILIASLLIGLIPILVDGIRISIEARLGLKEGHANSYARLFYFSWLPGMPLAGLLIDESLAYQKEILFFTLVALILSIAWLALVRSFLSLMLNAVFLGFAYSCLATTLVGLMTHAYFPHENAAAGLNVGFVAVGLGALLGPSIVQFIERSWGYRQGLLYVSVAIIIPAAMTALSEGSAYQAASATVLTWSEFLTHPHFGLIVGIILVYFAIENCLDFWPERYLLALGLRERKLQMTLSIFWLLFIAMRGVTAWWLYQYPHHAVGAALLFVVLSALILGNLVSGYEVGSGTFTFWALGACYGPILPCFLGIALESFYGKPLPASALGALLALSGLDTLIVRPLMTLYAKDRPARSLMRVPTVLALILGAPLVLMMFLRY
jgi:MFS family permease